MSFHQLYIFGAAIVILALLVSLNFLRLQQPSVVSTIKQSSQRDATDFSVKNSEESQKLAVPENTSLPPFSLSLVPKDTAFDHCGKIAKYQNESWYQNFLRKLERSGEYLNGIWEVCQSLDKKWLIILTNGGGKDGLNSYCEPGALYQYAIGEGQLSKAVFDDRGRGCVAWPTEFGPRSGNLITLEGSGGDAGCSSTLTYSYDISLNTIILVRECGSCQKEPETCVAY